ncbi:esterase/lipase family protein [Janthinobacterium sp. BJB301]|uniref:esterase/lipase family protein n=1 Tax=Janthinobacterium sp. BJB301 TaxID=1560195 RepID=UPI00117A37EF|nr:alpha/beta hydrolase [Janthinobacterium sp. BJB301]
MADLLQIHNPTDATGRARLVFIHGLDGDIKKTWMSDSSDPTKLWPKWIGEDLNCPVWVLGYGAAATRWKSDSMALPRQATAALERLCNEPALMDGPLILVGHSLGGLLIKTALQHGMSREVERHAKLVRNIKGIAFVGTPHFGSRLATLAAWSHLARANPQMSDLRLDNANLETLNQYFLKLLADRKIKTRVFIETEPVRLRIWALGRILPGVTIVSPTSAEAHIPGEVGIPVEANHFTISKPCDRSAAIHSSMVSFVREVETASLERWASDVASVMPNSQQMEAISPDQVPPHKVHLAFARCYGIKDADVRDQVYTSICLVTDAPDRLRQQVEGICKRLAQNPLISAAAKNHLRNASVRELVLNPILSSLALVELATMSFSAYLYFCPERTFSELSTEDCTRKLIVSPLVHRLSKLGESFEQVHVNDFDISPYVKQAAAEIRAKFHRDVNVPVLGARKYAPLEELAALLAFLSSDHLSRLGSEEAAQRFEGIRTRLRYAENVATGEKHTRDSNPLP